MQKPVEGHSAMQTYTAKLSTMQECVCARARVCALQAAVASTPAPLRWALVLQMHRTISKPNGCQPWDRGMIELKEKENKTTQGGTR